METFAEYILNEKDLFSKMEITYYLARKKKIFYDKSVILKSEIAKAFIISENITNINKNRVLTASLLYACKKTNGAQTLQKIQGYARESADFLRGVGFDEEFCNICQMHNRYGNIEPRNMEWDILELSDQLGRDDIR